MRQDIAEPVRDYARRHFLEPARKRNESTVRIIAGEIHKGLGLQNRVPAICQALKSRKFQEENRIVLEKSEGPPSGMSTTMTFVYRFLESDAAGSERPSRSAFAEMRGIAKDVFRDLDGGEAFLKNERDQFYGAEPKE